MNRKYVLITLAIALIAAPTFAQDKTISGSFGAGLSVTSGNSDTQSYNLSFNLVHDPGTKNLIKASALYLSGKSNDVKTIDNMSLGIRDEYTFSGKMFGFGAITYLKDDFKQLDYSAAVLAGVGYKILDEADKKFSVSVGAGQLFEQFVGKRSDDGIVFTAGQALEWKISDTASLVQSFSGLWKEENTSDAIYHAEIALTTQVTKASEIKLAIIDDYRKIPADPSLDKNDVGIIATFLMKF